MSRAIVEFSPSEVEVILEALRTRQDGTWEDMDDVDVLPHTVVTPRTAWRLRAFLTACMTSADEYHEMHLRGAIWTIMTTEMRTFGSLGNPGTA